MEMKGQNNGQYMVPVVCFSIILMDLIAGILGIQAEVAQNKVMLYCISKRVYLPKYVNLDNILLRKTW